MYTRLLFLVAIAAAVAALSPGRVLAHALDVTVKVPPDSPQVTVEVGFDDGTPAEKADVVITVEGGAVVARGQTDERGVWKFEKPAAGKYLATIEAVGHRTKVEFEIRAVTTSEPVEFTGWRPDRTLGVVMGVGGLLVVSLGYWWFRLRQPRETVRRG